MDQTEVAPNNGCPAIGVGGCAALTRAADAVLSQCESLVLSVPDIAYCTESQTMKGGTVGKHLRHTLDHFAAALGVVGNLTKVIEYDRRQRDVPMETDRRIALAAINELRDGLARASSEGLHLAVSVRVMLHGDGSEAELKSTLGRELAFATHHAVHHQAMMRAIAGEFGIQVDDHFGKAPSTLKSERGG